MQLMTKIFGKEIFQQRPAICDKEKFINYKIDYVLIILIIKIEYNWNIKINQKH